ncbi:P2X purinoceptor 3 isoform X2 [Folsomia candida]|uniref:P2X purinoceptor 3 isoform X2 n=1 Tax=Folsomia candida TaxID=158441 RepID=UPI001605215E|nr:P2X purinoceptor 3 isoform X2 [Folsomia candida]
MTHLHTKGLIISTNVAVTAAQTFSENTTCPEEIDDKLFHCITNLNCPKGTILLKGHGVPTGNCVESDIDAAIKTCEIEGWCPVARNTRPLKSGKALLSEAHILTIFLKSTVRIDALDVSLNNIKQIQNMKNGPDIESCIFDPDSPMDQHCPRFRLGDIIKYAIQEGNKTGDDLDFDQVALDGGVFMLKVAYDCDMDCYWKIACPSIASNRLVSTRRMTEVLSKPRRDIHL